MKRWRYNVYRVPPRRDASSGHSTPEFARRAGGFASEKEMAKLRQADSVYEDVM